MAVGAPSSGYCLARSRFVLRSFLHLLFGALAFACFFALVLAFILALVTALGSFAAVFFLILNHVSSLNAVPKLARLHFGETCTKDMYGNALLNYADLPGDLTDGCPDAGNQREARNRVCNDRQN
jgi:hypothetical protein